MRAGISAAIIAAVVLSSGPTWSACPPGKSRNCVNLELAPPISQQIVAREHLATPPKAAPVAEPIAPYTGPTIGLDPMFRRAPTVGYRWSIN